MQVLRINSSCLLIAKCCEHLSNTELRQCSKRSFGQKADNHWTAAIGFRLPDLLPVARPLRYLMACLGFVHLFLQQQVGPRGSIHQTEHLAPRPLLGSGTKRGRGRGRAPSTARSPPPLGRAFSPRGWQGASASAGRQNYPKLKKETR